MSTLPSPLNTPFLPTAQASLAAAQSGEGTFCAAPLGPPAAVPYHHLKRVGELLRGCVLPLCEKMEGVATAQEFFVSWMMPELLLMRDAATVLGDDDDVRGLVVVWPASRLCDAPVYVTPTAAPGLDLGSHEPLSYKEEKTLCYEALRRAAHRAGGEVYAELVNAERGDRLTVAGVALLQVVCANLRRFAAPSASQARGWSLYTTRADGAAEVAMRSVLLGLIFRREVGGSAGPTLLVCGQSAPSVRNTFAVIGELLEHEALTERIRCIHFPCDAPALVAADEVRASADIEAQHACGEIADTDAAIALHARFLRCVTLARNASEFVPRVISDPIFDDDDEIDSNGAVKDEFDTEAANILFARLIELERVEPGSFETILHKSLAQLPQSTDAAPKDMRRARRLPEGDGGLDWFAHAAYECHRCLLRCLLRVVDTCAEDGHPEMAVSAVALMTLSRKEEETRRRDRARWLTHSRGLRECAVLFLVQNEAHFDALRAARPLPRVRDESELALCAFTPEELETELAPADAGQGIRDASAWHGGVIAPENCAARDWRDLFARHMLAYVTRDPGRHSKDAEGRCECGDGCDDEPVFARIRALPVAFRQLPLTEALDPASGGAEARRTVQHLWSLARADTAWQKRSAAGDALRGLHHLGQMVRAALGRSPRRNVYEFWDYVRFALDVDFADDAPPTRKLPWFKNVAMV